MHVICKIMQLNALHKKCGNIKLKYVEYEFNVQNISAKTRKI